MAALLIATAMALGYVLALMRLETRTGPTSLVARISMGVLVNLASCLGGIYANPVAVGLQQVQ